MESDYSISEDESLSPIGAHEDLPQKRPARKRWLPTKLREVMEEMNEIMTLEELDHDQSRKVILKCSQNGKLTTAQVKDISREDSLPLSAPDFTPGASLLVQHKGKFYPVQFVRYKDEDISEKKTKVASTSEGKKKSDKQKDTLKKATLLQAKTDKENIKPSNKGKHPAKKPKIIAPDFVEDDDDPLTIADASFKERDHLEELLIRIEKKVETIERRQISSEKKLERILVYLKEGHGSRQLGTEEGPGSCGTSIKSRAAISGALSSRTVTLPSDSVKEEEAGCTENERSNSVNMMMRIHSKDAYSFGLTLLHSLFTQEELACSLLFQSKKGSCTKPGLDPVRVEQILSAMNKRYPNDPWEINTFQSKVNQKCRDAARKLRQNGMEASKDATEENGN